MSCSGIGTRKVWGKFKSRVRLIKFGARFVLVDWHFFSDLRNIGRIGKNNFRLLGFEDKDSFVVLTNGFKKKDQKVPKSEIFLAQKEKISIF